MQRKNLPYIARVWVPDSRPPESDTVSHALLDLVAAAGGTTSTAAQGTWIDGDQSVTEPVHVFEFVYSDEHFEVEPNVYILGKALLDAGEQAVLVEINGRRVLLTA